MSSNDPPSPDERRRESSVESGREASGTGTGGAGKSTGDSGTRELSPEESALAEASRHKLKETGGLPMRELFGVVPFRSVTPPAVGRNQLPDRYEIRATDEGTFLRCKEAPGLLVRVDSSINLGEAEARKLGERQIFLDGAGQFAPVVDDSKHLYNLDHHQGCLRAFTVATCEQALLVVLKGLDLDKGEWKIHANQPDLDTVFAIWVLLNHRRIRDLAPETRDRIVPLLRLESAIDANGFEIAEYCGLPSDVLARERARLDRLHELEKQSKKSGEWADGDLVAHAARMCFELDQLVFDPADLQDFASVEREYGHVEIGDDRVAVVCHDEAGIYDVESRLKKVWGDRLGIIALEKGHNNYTLRRTAALAGIDLRDAYERLNLLDPQVDGEPLDERWGGSDDIGGSPRPSGTGLTPREITKILRLTYRPVKPLQRFQHLATATLWVALLALLSGLAAFGVRQLDVPEADNAAIPLAVVAGVVGLGSFLLTRELSRGWTWLFGWRRPRRPGGWPIIPLVVVAGLAGGVWVPATVGDGPREIGLAFGAVVLAAIAAELWFRGLVHGLLILDSRVQSLGGPWFLSRPTAAAAVLYGLVTAGLAATGLIAAPWSAPGHWDHALVFGAALLSGLGLGVLRERSLSLWWGVLVQILTGAGLIALLQGPLAG